MAAKRLIKHNPLFMSDDQLAAAFVVRKAELQILADLVRANRGEVNQHALVIGPRGMGKTMLMRRLALLVRNDEALSGAWHPIVAPEEIYDAGTEGEIWLQVLKSLADQERQKSDEFERWSKRYEALTEGLDEERLRIKTLGALMEFSHERGRRLLVLIENLQMLLGEQFAKDADWDLRKTLLNRSEIMLVLTATTRFAKIEEPAFAAYELFRELELKPLSTDDSRRLWQAISGQDLGDQRIRPMEILTGGNPRVLSILAAFAPEQPLTELMDNLAELIDDHTPFLKSNIDALAPQERRVFVNLAKLWEPSTARHVGERCRLSSNTASAVLKSLVRRGAVIECGKEGRRKLYQVAERLYCIYYLMRLAGSEADRMRAFVRFMVPLYGEDSLARSRAEAASATADGVGYEVREEPGVYDIAAKLTPEAPDPRHTLAYIYGLAGRWNEAFEQMGPLINDAAYVETHLGDTIALLIDAAADGQAQRALDVLSGKVAERGMQPIATAAAQMTDGVTTFTKAAEQITGHFAETAEQMMEVGTAFTKTAGQMTEGVMAFTKAARQMMEPLVVALKELVGEKYRTPQEVEEVKKDVLAKIETRRKALSELRSRAKTIA